MSASAFGVIAAPTIGSQRKAARTATGDSQPKRVVRLGHLRESDREPPAVFEDEPGQGTGQRRPEPEARGGSGGGPAGGATRGSSRRRRRRRPTGSPATSRRGSLGRLIPAGAGGRRRGRRARADMDGPGGLRLLGHAPRIVVSDRSTADEGRPTLDQPRTAQPAAPVRARPAPDSPSVVAAAASGSRRRCCPSRSRSHCPRRPPGSHLRRVVRDGGRASSEGHGAVTPRSSSATFEPFVATTAVSVSGSGVERRGRAPTRRPESELGVDSSARRTASIRPGAAGRDRVRP